MNRAFLVSALAIGILALSQAQVPKDETTYQYSLINRREISQESIEILNEKIQAEEERIEKERLEEEERAREEAEKAKPLYGIIITLDPGHGITNRRVKEPVAPNSSTTKPGNVSGTRGVKTGISEQKLNLTIALKLKESLEKEGATVFLTRDSEKSDMTNIERAELGNEKNSDLVIRIHADGIDNPSVRGASVLVPANGTLSKDVNEKSRQAGEKILKAYVEKTGFNNRGLISRKDMTGFNWSKVPVVLIEMGFMSNGKEDELMNDRSFQSRMVEGITDGVLNFFIDK
ncbi:MAG: N-acetylmuramoyl-L-alanine amidase [Tissierellia bacterium]|nr:N-acetylmuramoyl-L-alanine amidase [Tissierellia bacterium]